MGEACTTREQVPPLPLAVVPHLVTLTSKLLTARRPNGPAESRQTRLIATIIACASNFVVPERGVLVCFPTFHGR